METHEENAASTEKCDSTQSDIEINQNKSDSENASNTSQIADPLYDKEFRERIETFYRMDKKNQKLKYVRCKLCVSMPNIVKLNSENVRMAPLATNEGCRYRQRYVSEHFQKKYHKACKMALDV